jgi:hypothetical protein
VLVDGVALTAPAVTLGQDTGARDSDGITANGRVAVTGLETGGSWSWATHAGTTWTTGTRTGFDLTGGAVLRRGGDGPTAGCRRYHQRRPGPRRARRRRHSTLRPGDRPPAGPVTDGTDATVGRIVADDPGGVTYALVPGDGDADNASIAVADDRLVLRDPAAAGAEPRTVRLAAVDLAGNRRDGNVRVDVTAGGAPVATTPAEPVDRAAATATTAPGTRGRLGNALEGHRRGRHASRGGRASGRDSGRAATRSTTRSSVGTQPRVARSKG